MKAFEVQVMEELFGKDTQLSKPLFSTLRKRTRTREDFEDSIIEFYIRAKKLLDNNPGSRYYPARYWVRVALSTTDLRDNRWLRPLQPCQPAQDLFCNPLYVEALAWWKWSKNDCGKLLV